MSRRSPRLIMYLVLLAASSLACNALLGDNGVSDSQNDNSSSILTEPVEEPAADDTEPAESLVLSQANNFGEPSGVNTYQISMMFRSEEITADGSERVSVVTADGARVVEPPSLLLVFNFEDTEGSEPEESITFMQVEDANYTILPDGSCLTGAVAEAGNPYGMLAQPGTFIGAVDGATLLERDVEVNGILTDHYGFSNSALNMASATLGGLSEIDGHVFIAKEGHLVRATMAAAGRSGLFDDSDVREGSIYYELNYFDFDEPVRVEPPIECNQAGTSDLPTLPDAAELTTIGGLTTYQSNFSLDEAAEFYKTEMTAAGWTLASELVSPPSATYSFTRDEKQLQISIIEDPDSGGLIVTIFEA